MIGVAAAACVGPTPASGERDELARVEAEPRAAEGRDGDEGSMATVDHSETVWATVNTDAPGGQTGMEGVSTMMDCPKHELPPPTEAEVVALVSGVHRSTLAHRPVDVAIGAAPGSGGLSAIELDVSPAGPGETKAGCGQVFELPVAVGLTIEEPKIDIEVKARIAALSSQYALLRAQLEPQALAPLGLPEPGPAQVTLGLAVAFTPEGIYGELETGGGPQCGVVVFPGNRRCDGFRRQTGLDIATAGVTPREVLQGFPRTFALNWESGDSTELTIELVGDPAYACGTSPPDDVSRSEHPLSLGALTHIETLDGRLNVELPAVVDYGVGTQSSKQPRSWDGGYHLVAVGLFPRNLLEEGGMSVPRGASDTPLLRVKVDLLAGPDFDELNVWIHGSQGRAGAAPPSAPVDLTVRGEGCFPSEPLISAQNY